MSINGLMYRNFCSYSFMLASLIFFMDFYFLLVSRSLSVVDVVQRTLFQTCELNFHLDMSNKVLFQLREDEESLI